MSIQTFQPKTKPFIDMYKSIKIFLLIFLIGLFQSLQAQDTFSIVAVDSVTGEIGSAGASCLDDNQITGGVLIISDVIPGIGAIHTQSYWLSGNQQNAHNRMLEGMSPQEIIDWLIENDVQNNPYQRQYGLVDFSETGTPRSAAYTGNFCLDWKGHNVGSNYSVQGNILLGEQIIDSIESRFLNTDGSLAEKLMAALQGANVAGADSRCLNEGVSSLSAFVRVARPNDPPDNLYCDIAVTSTPYGVEPIDSLQVLFDEWLNWVGVNHPIKNKISVKLIPNPARNHVIVSINQTENPINYEILIHNIVGNLIYDTKTSGFQTRINTESFRPGLYFYTIKFENGAKKSGKFSKL